MEGLKLKRPPWEVGELEIFWSNTWYEITNIINYSDLQSIWLAKPLFTCTCYLRGAVNKIEYSTQQRLTVYRHRK